jgi:transcriptional regulator with XRE-family HTH domain
MQIDSTTLKRLRKERGWTQQHLADASGLSLRTVQRIERDGAAANETVMALCAALAIHREQLSVIPKLDPSQLQPVNLTRHYALTLGALLLGMALGAFVMSLVS